MTEFEVIMTPAAEQDLREIFTYIATELFEPETAKKLCERISDEIIGLDRMPERHALYRTEPWLSRGLRFMPVGNFIVFYIVKESEKTVHILRILYGGKDIDAHL